MEKLVRVILIFIALIAVLTGFMDVVVGAVAQLNIGIDLPEQALRDPVLDSQVRFLGAIWFGFGVLIIYGLYDLFNRRVLLQGAMFFVILGGIGRFASAAMLGLPENSVGQGFVVFAIVIELVVAPFILLAMSKFKPPQ
jgi:hypothetical protein